MHHSIYQTVLSRGVAVIKLSRSVSLSITSKGCPVISLSIRFIFSDSNVIGMYLDIVA